MSQPQSLTPETQVLARRQLARLEQLAEGILEPGIRLRRQNVKIGPLPYSQVHNVVEFVGLLTLDLSCTLDDLVSHNGQLRTSVYARSLALLLLESTKTMESLLGKDFRIELASALGDPSADEAAKSAHKAINRVLRSVFDQFDPIRNELIAHKSANAERRARLLESLDHDAVARAAADLLGAMNPLLALIYRFLIVRAEALGLSAA